MSMINGAGMSAHYNTIAAARAQRTDPMKLVATTLGITTDELKSQLREGKSLVEIASGRNVDRDRLVAAVKEGLPTDVAADATRMAEEIVSTKGLPVGPSRGEGTGRSAGPGAPVSTGGPRGQVAGLDDAAKAGRLSSLLEVDADELTATVANAKELIDLMRDKGVDLGQLGSILTSGDLVDVSM
jgi:hypothetical protein